MPILTVHPEQPEKEPIERAAEVIRGGGLVAFPTETVYGLGANALDEAAVGRIYSAKGRPAQNPLIAHVASVEDAQQLVAEWPQVADRLAREFWPGPLTLVLPRDNRVPDRVSAGLATVAVRMPAHPVALALLRAAALPIVAPSANPSNAVSPTRAEHVQSGFGERRDLLILDAGPTGVGIESTVIDLTTEPAALLRPGAISTDDLEPFLGSLLMAGAIGASEPRPSPGMMERHYAPRAVLHVFSPSGAGGHGSRDAVARASLASVEGKTVGAILVGRRGENPPSTGEVNAESPFDAVDHLIRMPQDAAGYARELYAALHRLDNAGCDLVLVEAVPSGAAWAGIRDRLRRATSDPRP